MALLTVCQVLLVPFSYATDFSSTNFIIRDPVFTTGGNITSSTNFQQIGVTGQPAIGETSSTNFVLRSGFGYFPGPSLTGLQQNRYRWYDNVDALQPVTARAAENTKITIATGDNMRLRMSLRATDEVFPSASIFKLQFADRGNFAACSSVPSTSFVDLGPPSSSAALWVGYDNLSVTDGAQVSAALLTTAGGTGGSRQTYEEGNNTASTPLVISVGANADAEWDWSLKYRGPNNGLDYCFRMVLSDATLLGSYPTYPTVTIVTPAPSSSSSGGGGSGGSSTIIPSTTTTTTTVQATTQAVTQQVTTTPADKTSITFTGKAYSGSKVSLLKDGTAAGSFTASANGDFAINISDIAPGKYNFNIYTEDDKGQKSASFTQIIEAVKDKATKVENIILSPTARANKSKVKRGEALLFSGQSYPLSKVKLVIAGKGKAKGKITVQKQADSSGKYSYSFNSGLVSSGDYDVQAGTGTSVLSLPASFNVGSETVLVDSTTVLKSDLTGDKQVNVVDFSVMAFWHNKPAPKDKSQLEIFNKIDLNSDSKIDLQDFSILVTNWTG